MIKRKAWSIIWGLVLVSAILTGCAKDSAVIAPESSVGGIQTDTATSSSDQERDEDAFPTQEEAETVAPKRENTDFRNAMWGDDKETVKEFETAETVEGAAEVGEFLYTDSVVGYKTHVIYFFSKDGTLYEGLYGFYDEYTSAGMDIMRFNALKESLTEKYGEPYEDEIIPLEKQDQIDNSGESKSLEYGYVVYRAQWKTATTNIMLGMNSENYDVKTVIVYSDINYKEDVNDSGL